MHKVVIEHISPTEAIELKNQLLAAGLIMDQDFEWRWCPATYDNDGFSAVTPKLVYFKFVDAPVATFYKLKWT
jgi:hypothetical protein